MDNVTIELRKNHEHILSGREFKEGYELEYHENMIRKDIDEAIEEYEQDKLPDEIDDYIKEEIKDLETLKPGRYSLDVGDYTYHINIGGN